MRRKTERQGTEAERQLAWSREYLRREKRRRVLRRTLLMLVLALACAVTVFALNGGIPALRVGGAPASGSSAAQSSSAPAVQAQPPSSQAQPEPALWRKPASRRRAGAESPVCAREALACFFQVHPDKSGFGQWITL